MATHPEDRPDPINAVALLDEPTRRRLYDVVASADAPVGRDQAASAIGISRELAAFHLDRLADAGLLETEFQRLGDATRARRRTAREALPPRGARHRRVAAPARLPARRGDPRGRHRRRGRLGRHGPPSPRGRACDGQGRRCGGSAATGASGRPVATARGARRPAARRWLRARRRSGDRVGPPPQLPVPRPRPAPPRRHLRHEPRLGGRRRRGSRRWPASSPSSRRSPGPAASCSPTRPNSRGDNPGHAGAEPARRARARIVPRPRWRSSAPRGVASPATARSPAP